MGQRKTPHLSKKVQAQKALEKAQWKRALVIATYGRHYDVKVDHHEIYQGYTRGKRLGVCVGDHVLVSLQSQGQVCIEEVLDRRNVLFRSDATRSKQFAANIDQLFFVVAVTPTFSEELLGRALIAAHCEGIKTWIILNKSDQLEQLPIAKARLLPYEELGFSVLSCSALDEKPLRDKLLPLMRGQVNLLLGQSAMGKTTLLNALIPGVNAYTQEHSEALDAGKHTTTSTHLYELEVGGALIDSPGFQQFGLSHLDRLSLLKGFPEFEQLEACRFYDCTHQHEPGCAVLSSLARGEIIQARYDLYTRLMDEILK